MFKNLKYAIAVSCLVLSSISAKAEPSLPQLPILGGILGSSPEGLTTVLGELQGGLTAGLGSLSGGVDAGDGGMDALLPTGLLGLPLLLPSAGELLFSNNGGPLGVVTGLGGPLIGQLIPVFDVLTQEPDQLFTHFMEGGTIISTELVILPAVPLLTAPLALE